MILIDKVKNGFGYQFNITTEEGCFQILFGGNLDLYWCYKYKDNISRIEDNKSFIITKENYFLFSLFDELYNNIKNYNVFIDKSIKLSDFYYEKRPFKDNKIVWYSDDYFCEEASSFVIEQGCDCYKLTFKKGRNEFFSTYSVRLRNSGSRYEPFNIVFMQMYNKLCEYDPNYQQIHMEEYLYHKNNIKQRKRLYK